MGEPSSSQVQQPASPLSPAVPQTVVVQVQHVPPKVNVNAAPISPSLAHRIEDQPAMSQANYISSDATCTGGPREYAQVRCVLPSSQIRSVSPVAQVCSIQASSMATQYTADSMRSYKQLGAVTTA